MEVRGEGIMGLKVEDEELRFLLAILLDVEDEVVNGLNGIWNVKVDRSILKDVKLRMEDVVKGKNDFLIFHLDHLHICFC